MVCVFLKQSAINDSFTRFDVRTRFPSARLKKPTLRAPGFLRDDGIHGFLQSSCVAKDQPRALPTIRAVGWSVAFNSAKNIQQRRYNLRRISETDFNWSKVHRQSRRWSPTHPQQLPPHENTDEGTLGWQKPQFYPIQTSIRWHPMKQTQNWQDSCGWRSSLF